MQRQQNRRPRYGECEGPGPEAGGRQRQGTKPAVDRRGEMTPQGGMTNAGTLGTRLPRMRAAHLAGGRYLVQRLAPRPASSHDCQPAPGSCVEPHTPPTAAPPARRRQETNQGQHK
jgi:hypothetical protein